MSKFKFKLQKLLDIKVKDEEESKLRYTQAQNQKRIIENNLRNLENSYKKYSDIGMSKDIISQKITINYLAALTQSIKLTSEDLRKEEINVSKAKKDFIEKQIDRKSLETLKENELNRLKKEEDRLEQLKNDEFALYAYIRNRTNIS
ncbi:MULTISPECIES: flagellar export protein FliJ [Romboutsia]|uniref:Flagellar FliJ protein n=1 Tax=Romboutsia hominis TaxID=1507512 RepID=A0A2P2BPJ8_9FIRM|nr:MULTISPECIES: flagellar export protein FliJ [Romboutsia]MDB8790848.1 flagellar export protein FliJ [Romboutsia sp. 1001216sp1]MDB8792358.1 flagellar export protein FliJ [Romboutsia sp. 1001216sp1]MDB8795653.1 flagellar export protein FliJ [Romboutsia sp. 1001216sp1]MDB8798468.1 flagellar export protein FliJ [Romboutsia sp. 1001216sp1]MDB8800818.1 flagellar export protein FliJ [Romboutsia sp. 1001216sp1]